MPAFLIMAIPIKQTDKTLTFDLRQFAALGDEKFFFLCLNENTYYVTLRLFEFYGYWLNRYTPNTDGEILYQPEGEQAVFVGDMYDKGMEELLMPTCVDDLVEAINNGFASIATALGALELNCAPAITVEPPDLSAIVEAINDMVINANPVITVNAGSSGGDCCPPAQFGTTPGVPPLGPSTPPPALPGVPDPTDPMTDPPPDGFTSWEQFYANKCQVANKIVDDLIQTCHNFATIEGAVAGIGAGLLLLWLNTSMVTGLIAGVMALGFAAFDAAAIVLGAFVVIIAAGLGGLAFFEVLANDFVKQDLVCAIYNGHTPQEVYNNLKSILTPEIGGLPDITDLISDQIVKVILALLNTSITNMPFELHPELVGYISPDPVDCTDCVGGGSVPLCQTFDDDTQGWEADAAFADFEFGVSGSVSWADGQLQLDSDVSGSANQVGAKGPVFSHVIQTGDVICIAVTAITSGTYSSYVAGNIDGSEIELDVASGSEAPGNHSLSLEAYVGQTISQIWIGWAKTGASFSVVIDSAGINCEECLA